jgi:hypothetical protein
MALHFGTPVRYCFSGTEFGNAPDYRVAWITGGTGPTYNVMYFTGAYQPFSSNSSVSEDPTGTISNTFTRIPIASQLGEV